jgi:hypothetical protein
MSQGVYTAQIRIQGMGITETTVSANSTVMAKKLMEAQYGKGNVMSVPRIIPQSR